MSQRIARLLGEFVVVVVGVLSALAVDDYRDGRADRAFEAHLLSGISADLARDTVDAAGSLRAAQGRAAAADELLEMLGDPLAGNMPPMDRDLDQHLQVARLAHPHGSLTEQHALLMLADQRRLDFSDASFGEAVASGRLYVIRDLVLRSAISTHYFQARRYEKADERVEEAAKEMRDALAAAGLALTDGATDVGVLEAFKASPRLVAELKNIREFALRQIDWDAAFRQSAEGVLREIEATGKR